MAGSRGTIAAGFRNRIRGIELEVALAEGRPEEAIAYYRERRSDPDRSCIFCWMWDLGNAHDAAGNADSAIAWFELHLATPSVGWFRNWNAREYPIILRRLGELYDERGDRDRAIEYYSRFIELWKDADPELQPAVQNTRERLARLVEEPNRGS